MADIETFCSTMAKLEQEMTELDRQLNEESLRARDLELAAASSGKKREEIGQEIRIVIGEICELEIEAEDLDCLQSQSQVPRDACSIKVDAIRLTAA